MEAMTKISAKCIKGMNNAHMGTKLQMKSDTSTPLFNGLFFCLPTKQMLVIILLLTFITTARPHARLKILRVWAFNAKIQLGLQHPLPHSLALLTRGRTADRPWRPIGVDTGLWSIICRMIKGVRIYDSAVYKHYS